MPAVETVVGYGLTILAGVGLSVQSGANSTLGKQAGKSFASVVSFSTGLAALLIYYAVDVHALHNKGPTTASVKDAPWWSWTGGVLGAFYVVIVIIFAQILGAGSLIAVFVTSQLVTAIALDGAGIVGYQRLTIRWQRLLGAVLLVCGVILITAYKGEPVVKEHPPVVVAAETPLAAMVPSAPT